MTDASRDAEGARHRAAQLRARIRALADVSRRAAEDARRRAEHARRRWPVVDRGFDIAEEDRNRYGNLLAGALAYRLFLWLLPFSLLVVGVLGAVDSVDPDSVDSAAERAGLGDVLSDLLQDGAGQSGWWVAILVGLSGTAYAGIGAARALRVSHAAAWGMRPQRMRKALVASAALSAAATGVLVLTLLAGWARHNSLVGGLFTLLALTALYFVVWLRISARLPHGDAPVRALVPGAAIVAVGVQGLHVFTSYYLVDQAERSTSVYGAIGAALVILLWLFLVARLMVAGAVINADGWARRTRARPAARGGDPDHDRPR